VLKPAKAKKVAAPAAEKKAPAAPKADTDDDVPPAPAKKAATKAAQPKAAAKPKDAAAAKAKSGGKKA